MDIEKVVSEKTRILLRKNYKKIMKKLQMRKTRLFLRKKLQKNNEVVIKKTTESQAKKVEV